MLENKGERLWNTLPGLVPKSQWETQLEDVHSNLEGLLLRVRRLEAGGGHHQDQLAHLNRKCHKELATEQQLTAAATKIQGEASEDRRDFEQRLEDLRAFTLSQLKILKVEFSREVANLNSELKSANKDIRALGTSIKDLEVTAVETYQTKTRHDADCRDMRREAEVAAALLQETCDGLTASRATRKELAEAQLKLKDAHEDLEHRHGQTLQKLAASNSALALLEQQSQKNLADSVDFIQRALDRHSQEHQTAANGMNALLKDLHAERSRVNDTLSTQADHTEKIKGWMLSHGELARALAVAREELTARCDKQERDLKELDRREKSSWEQFLCDRT